MRLETGLDWGQRLSNPPLAWNHWQLNLQAPRHLQICRLTIAAVLDLFRGARLNGIAIILYQTLTRSKAKAKISNNARVKQLTTQAQGHADS